MFGKIFSKLTVHGKTVWLGKEENPSMWQVRKETAEKFTLRRNNLWAPLGSYTEITVSKDSDLILAVQTY